MIIDIDMKNAKQFVIMIETAESMFLTHTIIEIKKFVKQECEKYDLDYDLALEMLGL